jgi:type I restriction enzyme S subunit
VIWKTCSTSASRLRFLSWAQSLQCIRKGDPIPHPQNYYYNFIINSDYGKSIIRPLSRRAGQPHINADQVKSLRFPVPPTPLQEEFARIVHQFKRLRAQQREAQRQAEHLFQTLLHRAFRGEL